MASIYGLTLKALKKFTGHDGEPCYQGNLYLGTKKIGFWTEDGRGGSGIYRMDPPYREGKLNVRVKELHAIYHPEDTEYYDLDCLMQEIISLLDDEKFFKKAAKEGYAGTLTVSDGWHVITWKMPKKDLEGTDAEVLARMEPEIETLKKREKFFPENGRHKHELKLYRNLSDFKIGEPISLEEIQ